MGVMSGLNSNNSENKDAIYQNDEDNTRPYDSLDVGDDNSELNSDLGLLQSIRRSLVPAFIRHNFYHLSHRVRQAIRYESETGARFLTLPVAFAIGALAYFSLPREPLLSAILVALVLSIIIANKTYGSWAGNFALISAFVFAGMASGKLRSDMLDTTMIGRSVQVQLSGIVLNREVRANGRQRYTIAVSQFEDNKGPVPQKIRVTAHKKYASIEIGQGINGLARLRPPSGPAYPGGYDFAFQSWYNGIGANGFFLGAPKAGGSAVAMSSYSGYLLQLPKHGQRLESAFAKHCPAKVAALPLP